MLPSERLLQVRVSKGEKAAARDAAALSGLTLSAWVRQAIRLTAAAALRAVGRDPSFVSEKIRGAPVAGSSASPPPESAKGPPVPGTGGVEKEEVSGVEGDAPLEPIGAELLTVDGRPATLEEQREFLGSTPLPQEMVENLSRHISPMFDVDLPGDTTGERAPPVATDSMFLEEDPPDLQSAAARSTDPDEE